MEQYKTVLEGGTGEIVEKKSRFIATVRPVKNEEEALAFLEEMRKKYWDARHNCYAYSIGKNREFTRCSDDGEPSGTAGRPMLDVILGEDIYNVAVVVTRYFGGVLLGTGGLVRAYSKAVQEGLGITEPVNSPTFTIVQVYEEGRLPFYHFDVYRIGDIEEMEEIGYDDYFFGEGICLIEWAELIEEILPENRISITIEKDLSRGFDYRRITIEGLEL